MATAVFISSKDQKKESVEIHFTMNHLELFRGSQSPQVLRYQSIQMRLGGNNNTLLFFECPELQGDLFYVELSHELMAVMRRFPLLEEKVRFIRRFRSKEKLKSSTILILFLIPLVALFYFRKPLFGQIGEWIPLSTEKLIAEKIFKSSASPEQKGIESQLVELLNPLLLKDSSKSEYVFHINSSMDMNAYASIGGHIFVNKGLILKLQNPEQLLGVIAHEMEHVKNRHIIRSLSQVVGVFGVVQILLGDISGVVAILIDQGSDLLQFKFSREFEDEADQKAILLLANSQINPVGLPEALNLIFAEQKKEIQQTLGGDILKEIRKIEILSTHPDPEKRIAALFDLASKNKINQALPLENFKTLQVAVKEKF